jgi:hypothetical protein
MAEKATEQIDIVAAKRPERDIHFSDSDGDANEFHEKE